MTDTDALTERIRREIHAVNCYDSPEECIEDGGACVLSAAAVLPIIRKAQADAWDEGSGGRDDLRPNPYRGEQDTP